MASTSRLKDKVKQKEWNIMGKMSLLTLDLSDKHLTQLPEELFELKDIEALDLTGNENIDLSDELIKLTNLKVLCLDGCNRESVPAVVTKLSQLEGLILSHNNKITLPDEMSSLVNLNALILTNCNLDSLPPVVLQLSNLQELDLSTNQISLPDEVDKIESIKVLRLLKLKLTQLEELDLSENSGIHLPDELCGLNNIRVLKLRGTDMVTVPPAVWRLTQLEWLDLSWNRLRTLPAEIKQITNVKHLDLSRCELHTLPPEVGRLTKLEWLDLCANALQTLPAEIGQITNVKHLDLSGCELRTLPPDVGRLAQLERLYLHCNPLQTLPAEIGQITNVKHLNMSKCELRTLPPEVGRLTQLEWLNLTSNPLQTLPTVIGQLTNAKHLVLFGCELRTLPPEVGRLTQLEQLQLSSNPLQTLQPAEIGQLTNVKHLDLSGCELRTLPPEVGRLKQLERLDLKRNPLQSLPAEIGQITNVKHLDLSFCALRTLPPEVGRLKQLERLDLNRNPLQTLPAEIGQLTNVKHLDLSKCQLHTLPSEVGRLTQLEWLDLSFNPLEMFKALHIPEEIGQLNNVKHLDLSLCKMRTLPPEVWTLIQLEWLNLSSNPLQMLPEEIGQLTNVKHLDLSSCKLHTLPPEVGRLAQLEWLNLSSNALQTLPEEIGQLNNVKCLGLSHCQLTNLPDEVSAMIRLVKLDVSQNKLTHLPDTIWLLRNLQALDASENVMVALPVKLGQLKNLIDLNVDRNPLIKPPPEVCRQGIIAIRQYFGELEHSKEDVSAHLKVVILGESMAGKTSLVQTISCGESTLTKEEDRTHCVDITQWTSGDNITFEVYDFGGHDVYHLTHQFFLTQDAFYLLLVNLEKYSCSEQGYKEHVEVWLDILNARVPGAVVSVIGSKKDRCRRDDAIRKINDIKSRIKIHREMWETQLKRRIARLKTMQATQEGEHSKSLEDITQQLGHSNRLLRQRLRIVGDVLCVSAKPKSLIRRLFSSKYPSWVNVIKLLLETGNNSALFPSLRRVLPRTWVLFEQMLQRSTALSGEPQLLERAKQPTRYWLTSAECKRIGRLAELASERLEPVLSYLQQVGTILRYKDIPELRDIVFHDPPALIEIFKDLFHHDIKGLFKASRLQTANYTSAELHNFEQDLRDRGLIRKDIITCLLPPNVNPDIVTTLMQHFGLCFKIEVKGNKGPSEHTYWYRIPWYLREQMPQKLKSVWTEEVPDDQEQLQLMCNITGFCPKGLFQRFSVGIHPIVKDRTDWKDGVMAYKQDYPVLACSKLAADDIYITMATRGRLDQADEMWGVILPLLKVLVQLLQEWPGVLYSLHVTCAHCIKAGLDKPHQYDLRDRTADDGRDVRCPGVEYAASTSANLVYRAGILSEQARAQLHVKPHDRPQQKVSDELDILRWLLTEVKVSYDAYEDNYNRLASRVSELGLTFRAEVPGDGNCMFHAVSDQVLRTEGRHIGHLQLREQTVDHLRSNPRNARGDHLSNFVSNHSWEEYLETMSRDGTWGDHIVLQAMADMLGRDVTVVSSLEVDNYVTTLHPQSGASSRAARPLLLGHYAENHYASLNEKPLGDKPVVLLVNDEFGTSKGGISTINGQLVILLASAGAKVIITMLNATEEEKQEALGLGIDLILPNTPKTDETPTLDWLTYDNKSRYPNLPSDINVIVGHADVTSTAARNIRKDRLPLAKFILFNHVMPEDTEHHKGSDKVMSIEDKMDAIRNVTENADVVFSVGPTMHDYYKNQIRLSKPHHLFLPKPSDIFSQMDVTYVETETKVVLCVGRVKGVEKLKGYDLVAKAMCIVIDRFPMARLRVRGVSAEDFPESKEIIQANMKKGTFHFTPLKYGTQQQLSRDFKEAHLVLMPSRAEPFGLVGLEAITAGVPVLVSSKSGLAEFLESKGPEFDRPIVDIDGSDDVVAERLAKRIIKILKGGRAEFEAAKRLKDKLLASEYWNESHRKFLEECGIPQ